MAGLTFRLLEDGAQTAADVVATITSFVARAQRTLDVAIYDFHARTTWIAATHPRHRD